MGEPGNGGRAAEARWASPGNGGRARGGLEPLILPFGEPRGGRPAKRRPVLVIQGDPFNASKLGTTIAAVITSNTRLAAVPGNVFLPARASGLPHDSTVNVSTLVTLDKSDLISQAGTLPAGLMAEVDRGLRRVLGLH